MYRLKQFGLTDIEYLNQVDQVGSGLSPSSYMPLPDGGAIDGYASRQMRPGVVDRTKQMRLYSSDQAALEAIYLTLLSLKGKRDKLYRRTSQGDIHWQYARLVEINGEYTYELTPYRRLQDIALHFVTQDAAWRGAYHTGNELTFDSGLYFDTGLVFDSALGHSLSASPDSYTVTVGAASDPGRAIVRALKITIDAGNSIMSNVTIARTGGESLTYTGNIPSGGSLAIDCGLMAVTCTGVSNAYNNLTISATADMAAWFTLQPGDNTITVTYTGGGTGKKISFEFYEAWE